MSEETAPLSQDHPSSATSLPVVENLANSDDANVLEARAKLLEAQAKLTRASTPLFDKIILRGILPLAIAVVGPWALWEFNTARVEQEQQGQVIVELQELLEAAKMEASSRQEQNAEWRERMNDLEQEKAVELTAMSTMVCRLDDMLKSALVQQAIHRVMDQELRGPSGMAPLAPSRSRVVQAVTDQIQLPGINAADLKKIAGQQYDRISKTRK